MITFPNPTDVRSLNLEHHRRRPRIDRLYRAQQRHQTRTARSHPLLPIHHRRTMTSVRLANDAHLRLKQQYSLAGLGSLDFDIIWEEALNLLKIKLFRARNLRPGDSNGLSDPYIKVHLVPGVAKVTSNERETNRSADVFGWFSFPGY